ncbi:MAG: restriction endonuclease subunit S, partial [Pseudobdellovibrio sp.]
LISEYIAGVTAGSAMPAVNFDIVSKIQICFPMDMDEQLKITNYLDQIDKYLLLKDNKLSSLENLKKALMNDLLSGKVRVKV